MRLRIARDLLFGIVHSIHCRIAHIDYPSLSSASIRKCSTWQCHSNIEFYFNFFFRFLKWIHSNQINAIRPMATVTVQISYLVINVGSAAWICSSHSSTKTYIYDDRANLKVPQSVRKNARARVNPIFEKNELMSCIFLKYLVSANELIFGQETNSVDVDVVRFSIHLTLRRSNHQLTRRRIYLFHRMAFGSFLFLLVFRSISISPCKWWLIINNHNQLKYAIQKVLVFILVFHSLSLTHTHTYSRSYMNEWQM